MQGPTTLQMILYALLLLGAGYALGGWLAGRVHDALDHARVDPAVRRGLVAGVRPGVLLLAIFAASRVFGVDPTAFLIVLAAAALAVALAVRPALEDAISGALVQSLRPFRVGDTIEVFGSPHQVLEIGLMYSVFKTSDGTHLTVTNRQLLGWPIANPSANGLRQVTLSVRVAPETDVSAAKAAFLVALGALDALSGDPAPDAHVVALDASGIALEVTAWVHPDAVPTGREAMLLAIQAGAKREHVALISVTIPKD